MIFGDVKAHSGGMAGKSWLVGVLLAVQCQQGVGTVSPLTSILIRHFHLNPTY